MLHYLSAECFLLTYDLNGFTFRVNSYLIFGYFQISCLICFSSLFSSFSCNSIPCSCCSALSGVNLNFDKEKENRQRKQCTRFYKLFRKRGSSTLILLGSSTICFLFSSLFAFLLVFCFVR